MRIAIECRFWGMGNKLGYFGRAKTKLVKVHSEGLTSFGMEGFEK